MVRAATSGRRSFASHAAWFVVALSFALGVAGNVLSPPGQDGVGDFLLYDASWFLIIGAWAVVGALIAGRQPRNPIGWILCGLTLFAGVVGLCEGYADRYLAADGGAKVLAETAAWLSNWAYIPAVLVPLTFVPLYFPSGALPSRRWRVVPWLAGVGMGAFSLSEAFASGPLHDYPTIVNPYGIDSAAVDILGLGSVLILISVLASVGSVVVRFHGAGGVERQQIKWLAYAGCLAAVMLIAGGIVGMIGSEDAANALIIAGVAGLPVAIGIAILRHRLYDIDLLINRTLVYGGLTAGVVALYVALVGGLSAVFHEQAGFWLSLLATGVAALLIQPLRSRLQRRVNRLVYAPSVDGPAGTGGLRGRLHEAFVPEAGELQRVRERLVAAREEERRRLRRDLHDGLGPALAGAALEVEAAGNLLASDHAAAASLLDHARSEIQDAVADIRRLVYDLRPPALDELGLVGALREQAGRLSAAAGGARGAPRIQVDAPAELDALPAAVEVAAYRIALEGMTNATRHAHANICAVRISVDGALDLAIVDDGDGFPDGCRPGVGITSMRERAEELGGSCEIEREDNHGTRVHARLPLGSA